LTGLPRFLARQACRRGPADHKASITTSRKRGKPASGWPNQPIIIVEQLARYQYRAALFALLSEPI
jgi:hypothetical protein